MVKIFVKPDEISEVEIEDEFDNIFVCNIWWGHRANQAHPTQGWGEFCVAHELRGGSTLCCLFILTSLQSFTARLSLAECNGNPVAVS